MSAYPRSVGPVAVLMLSTALGCASGAGQPASPDAESTPKGPTDKTAAELQGGQSTAEGQLMLSVRVVAYQDGERVQIPPGGTLRSGDRFALELQMDRPAFIYVVQFFADGTSEVLFPSDGKAFVGATQGNLLRIPPGGSLFALDNAVGEENVYIIASERPLDEADASVAERVAEVRRVAADRAGGGAPADENATAAAPPPTEKSSPPPKSTKTEEPPPAGTAPPPKPPKQVVAKAPRTRPERPLRLSMATRGIVRVAEDAQGPKIEAKSDKDGIAIVRCWFKHVAR